MCFHDFLLVLMNIKYTYRMLYYIILLLLLLHQYSLRAHFQVSININKYIIESEARTVRRLTKSDIEKVCLESLPENVI